MDPDISGKTAGQFFQQQNPFGRAPFGRIKNTVQLDFPVRNRYRNQIRGGFFIRDQTPVSLEDLGRGKHPVVDFQLVESRAVAVVEHFAFFPDRPQTEADHAVGTAVRENGIRREFLLGSGWRNSLFADQ